MEEYWIDIQDQLNRVAYVYGNKKMYEKLVPVVLNELKANEDKKCVLDFGHVKGINKDLADAIANILKAYGLNGNTIQTTFASDEDKEAFRKLFPEKLEEIFLF